MGKLASAIYAWAGLGVAFMHWHYVAVEHGMPPAASILMGVLWPVSTFLFAGVVLF